MLRNLVARVDDGRERALDRTKLQRFVVHRIDFSKDNGGDYWHGVRPVPRDVLDGIELAQRFRDTRRVPAGDRRSSEWRDRPGVATGGENPYTFLGRYPGSVDQMLRVTDYGPHARRWSWTGVSYAVSGDFRVRPGNTPHAGQWQDLVEMAALFRSWLGGSVRDVIHGHDELPHASHDASKECPGLFLDMHRLRWEVEAHEFAQLHSVDAEARLLDLGVEF